MRNRHIRRQHVSMLCISIALAVMTILDGRGAAQTAPEFASIRQGLSQRLDSLEIRKQELKRTAQPIDELDKQSQTIRDSLILLRFALEKAVPAMATAPVEPVPYRIGGFTVPTRFMPRNVFDRIIAAVILVALAAGVILIIGLIIAALRRRGVPRRKRGGGRASGAPQLQAMADDFRRQRFDHPPVAGAGEINPAQVEELRRRVGEQPGPDHNLPADDHSTLQTGQPPRDSDEVRRAVINAARDGMTIPQICRRFHLGSDHVALLLKVAQKGNPRQH